MLAQKWKVEEFITNTFFIAIKPKRHKRSLPKTLNDERKDYGFQSSPREEDLHHGIRLFIRKVH